MKIAVVGAGGVGGVFGARLAAAGHEVGLVARGAHLEAIRSAGLRINGGPRDLHVRPAFATDRPEEIGTAEAVLVAVKQWDLEAAGEAARPLVGPDTTVVPLQNGIDARERLGAILGLDRVIGGTAFINAFISGPGSIEQHTPFNRLVFGEWDGQSSARVEALAAACGPADIEAVASANIELDIWKKFVFLVAVSSVNAVVRGNNGVVRRCPETEALIGICAEEVAAVGRARGVPLDADAGEQAARLSASFGDDGIASMAADLIRGTRLELPWLAGKAVALAREMGVPVPALETIHAALLPWQDGAAAVAG